MKRTPLRRATPLRRSRKRLKIRIRKKDVEWARAVKERDEFMCQYCRWMRPLIGAIPSPKPRGLHAAHIFGRSRKSVRWELANGIALCMSHHLWLHAHPLDMIEFAKLQLGPDQFDSLRRRAMGIEEKTTVTG